MVYELWEIARTEEDSAMGTGLSSGQHSLSLFGDDVCVVSTKQDVKRKR
jgi:hypothetical protein